MQYHLKCLFIHLGKMEIRKAKKEDFESFKQLNLEVQQIHYDIDKSIFKSPNDIKFDIEEFNKNINSQEYEIFLACNENNSIIGYILIEFVHLNESLLKNERKFVLIHQLVVLSNFRNTGIGKKLVNEVISHSKNLGYVRFEIDVWSDNHSAKIMYQKYGFKTFREKLFLDINNP